MCQQHQLCPRTRRRRPPSSIRRPRPCLRSLPQRQARTPVRHARQHRPRARRGRGRLPRPATATSPC
ncbi:hypothetical protein FJQ89_10860 [Janthinobacterium tructae]|uniref:Uncharacterized protein n=1 Tax=Janthinobacterium tructae TaxID=2590869 RepID=A0A4Y6RM84_9BURK|nr:hypothetical protein FJQ89_10860 [Janthinobacterium tructae]